MKNQEIVFYNDMDSYEMFDECKQDTFECFGESNEWESVNDVPDECVWKEIYRRLDDDWAYLSHKLERLIANDYYLLTGTCGRWDGPAEGGKFINSFAELRRCISHLDYFKMYEVNGHFYIEGYHHDGHDYYELKKLTRKGYDYASNNNFARDRTLHTNIMKHNLFSTLPRFAKSF